jgi:hypothetical protein
VSAVAEVLTAQAPSGAFRSIVHHYGEIFPDENGFVTALIVRELDRLALPGTCAAVERALDFLESCRGAAGAFHFYPPGLEPEWMGRRLAADADDTALFAATLLAHGRLDLAEADRLIAEVLDPFRVHYWPESEPAWVRPGCYRTWLDLKAPLRSANPVDCCVNVNVAAFLAVSGQAGHPGYAAAVRTVTAGLRWAGAVEWQARSLVPWYPHPAEILHALSRAVAAGVGELAGPLAECAAQPWAAGGLPAERPVCGSLAGKTLWFCPALQALRQTSSDAGVRPGPWLHRSFFPSNPQKGDSL